MANAIDAPTPFAVNKGGTGASTLTDHGVLVGSGTSAITALTVGTSGQMLTSVTGLDPIFSDTLIGRFKFAPASIAATTDDTVTIENNGNAVSMANTGGAVLFRQFYYDAVTPLGVDAGRIVCLTEGNWTSTASTQDSKLSFQTALDGVVAERMAISSSGTLSLLDPLDVTYGGTGLSSLTSNGVLVGAGSGNVNVLAEASDGQLLIGSTGNPPQLATLTQGSNVTITNGAGTITIAASMGGGGLAWAEVTGTSQSAAVDSGYITNNASLVTVTLPSTAAIGDVVAVVGKGAGGWKLGQNAGQTVHMIGSSTTTGTGGSLASTAQYDTAEVACITANTDFVVRGSTGNLTIV